MKKNILLSLLILTATALHAQWLTPTGSLRLSLIGSEITRVEGYGSVANPGTVKTDITIGAHITKFFTASTRVETYCFQEDGDLWFTPYQNNYYVSLEAHYKGVKLGAEHACYHPSENDLDIREVHGGYSRVYFEVGF